MAETSTTGGMPHVRPPSRPLCASSGIPLANSFLSHPTSRSDKITREARVDTRTPWYRPFILEFEPLAVSSGFRSQPVGEAPEDVPPDNEIWEIPRGTWIGGVVSINKLVHLDQDSHIQSQTNSPLLGIYNGFFVYWKAGSSRGRNTRCEMEYTQAQFVRAQPEATEVYIHVADCPKTDSASSSISSSFICSSYSCPSPVSPCVDYLVQVMAPLSFPLGHVYSLQAQSGVLA
jgi:hypothetical protein